MDKLIVILFATLASLAFTLLMSWPVFMLWNECLVGAVRGVNQITWLQAWGLLVLAGILFKESSISFSK